MVQCRHWPLVPFAVVPPTIERRPPVALHLHTEMETSGIPSLIYFLFDVSGGTTIVSPTFFLLWQLSNCDNCTRCILIFYVDWDSQQLLHWIVMASIQFLIWIPLLFRRTPGTYYWVGEDTEITQARQRRPNVIQYSFPSEINAAFERQFYI